MELWGLNIETWSAVPERAEVLPDPLGYDTLNDGLIELEMDDRRQVLQGLSSYQVCNDKKYLYCWQA